MRTLRRGVVSSVAALGATGVLAGAMVPLRGHLGVGSPALVLMVPVVGAVVVGGLRAGLVGVVGSFLVYDVVFVPPYGSLRVGNSEAWVALGVYVTVMLLVANVVARLEAARVGAHQRERAIRRLFDLTDLLIEDRPLPEVLELVVSTVRDAFDLRSVALMLPAGSKLEIVASAGDAWSESERRDLVPGPGIPARLPTGSAEGRDEIQTVALSATGRPVGLLRVRGGALSRHDQALLRTFANHMALALERGQLREQALRTELLEEVDRLQRALLQAVSHDLRTPLATIKMAATTLRSDETALGPDERTELLGLVDDQSDRLDRLVENLLDVSRVQSGVLEVRSEPVALVDLVHEAVRGLGRRLHGTPVTLDLDPDLPLVEVDHVLVGQVLTNLLENAARHAPPGTAVTVAGRPGDDGRVVVAVEDRGPGVPRGDRANVFLLFNRGPAGGGTGVGLSVARAFLAAHGQDIWIEDNPGGGARFCFTLPIAPEEREDLTEATALSEAVPS